ncbi:MAG: hypothetical protein KBC17_02300, partial [Candidatus Pacebacteria bacterium]|nr:hypothetical protein [Candidatus Paceibacterota bacterium]
EGRLKVSGKLNKSSTTGLTLRYNKLEKLPGPGGVGTFMYVNLENQGPSTGPGGGEITGTGVEGGYKSISIDLVKASDGTSTFSVETGEITEGGGYVFALASVGGIGGSGFFYTKWASNFYEFVVETPTPTQIQLIHPIKIDGTTPEDTAVTIRIATNKKDPELGQIQLGYVNIKGKSGSCVLDPSFTSPESKSVSTSGGDAVLEYTFSKDKGYTFTPGVYCISARSGDMQEFLKFTGKDDWFKLFGAIVPDDFTIDPAANANGCVEGEGGYCLLAPLPGVGDETGRVDIKQGIGNYFNSIIRLIIGLIGVLSVLMIVVGGIQYMSTVAMEEKNNAKRRITHAIFGLIVALGSYSILNTINPKLVNVVIHVPGSGPEQSDMGEEPDASITDISPDTVTPAEDIVLPAGDIAGLAKQILESPKISLNILNVADANGTITLKGKKNLKLNEAYSGPKQQIQDTADGKKARLSSWAENGALKDKTTALSARMLAGILAVANQFQITVTAVAGGDHSAGSVHYSGLAFDIQSAPSEVSQTKSILKICKAAGAQVLLGPCGSNFPYPSNGSTVSCAETGGLTNSGHKTHIHCQWGKKSSPEADSDSAESLAGICKSPNPGPSCGEPKICAPLAAKIDKVVSDDPAMAKFLKGILLAESSCGINIIGPMTKDGQAFGPFQQLVGTAQTYAKACNIKEPITAGWLKNPANFEKDVCITRKYVEALRSGGCGSDWRNIAAGYNGGDAGACNPSIICEPDKSCINGSTVMRWECPWDSKEAPRKANVGYRGTREYSSKIQYCTVTNPPSWMK